MVIVHSLLLVFAIFLTCFTESYSSTWIHHQRDASTLGCKSKPKGAQTKRLGPFALYDALSDTESQCYEHVCVPFNDTVGIWTKRFLADRCCFYENFPLLIGQTIILDDNSVDQCSQTEVTCRLERDKPREQPRIEIRSQQTRCCIFNEIPIKSGEQMLYPEKCSVAVCRASRGSNSLELFVEPVFDGCRCCVNGNILVRNGHWTTENVSGRNTTCIDGKMFVVDEVYQQEVVNVKVEEAFATFRSIGGQPSLRSSSCEKCFKGDTNPVNFGVVEKALKDFVQGSNITNTIFVFEDGNDDQQSGIRFLASTLSVSESTSINGSSIVFSSSSTLQSHFTWKDQCVNNYCEISKEVTPNEETGNVEGRKSEVGENLLHFIRKSNLDSCQTGKQAFDMRILVVLVATENSSSVVTEMITGLPGSFHDVPVEQIVILVVHLNNSPSGNEANAPSTIYSSGRVQIYGMKLGFDRRIFDCWTGCRCITPIQGPTQIQQDGDIKPVFAVVSRSSFLTNF